MHHGTHFVFLHGFLWHHSALWQNIRKEKHSEKYVLMVASLFYHFIAWIHIYDLPNYNHKYLLLATGLIYSWSEMTGEALPRDCGGILGVGVGLSNWQLSQLLLLHVDRLQWTPVDFKNSFPLFSPLVIVLDVDLLADYRCNLTLLILMNWFLSRKI